MTANQDAPNEKVLSMGTSATDMTRVVCALQDTLEQASRLLRSLDPQKLSLQDVMASERDAEATRLKRELAELETDREELVQQLVDSDRQMARTMNLYVATYQLHATLDPIEVQGAIAEIAVDLLGAKSFVLLLQGEGAGQWKVALRRDVDVRWDRLFEGDLYVGGDAAIDATLSDSTIQIETNQTTSALAVVPLRVDNGTVGVLAVFEVLEHHQSDVFQDRDLLDLLSVHAGSALLAAQLYASTNRKLKTLKGLVGLLPGSFQGD